MIDMLKFVFINNRI